MAPIMASAICSGVLFGTSLIPDTSADNMWNLASAIGGSVIGMLTI